MDDKATIKASHGKLDDLILNPGKWSNYGKFRLLLEKWDMIKHSRLSVIKGFGCWLSIKNLPLDLWRKDIFEVIDAHFRGLEGVELDTLNLIRCTDARIKVREIFADCLTRVEKQSKGQFFPKLW